MSPPQKVLLFTALGVVALFAGLMFVGHSQNDSHGRDRDAARRLDVPAWLKKTGALFQSHTPRIPLPGPVLTIEPATPLTIAVPPGDASFRSATLRLTEGAVLAIAYLDDTAGGPEDLHSQQATLPDPASDEPAKTTIIAMKKGGALTLTCLGMTPCRLEVQ